MENVAFALAEMVALQDTEMMILLLQAKKKSKKATSTNADEKLLNPAGEYAVKFAESHGINISDALEQPMVKARIEFFNQTGM